MKLLSLISILILFSAGSSAQDVHLFFDKANNDYAPLPEYDSLTGTWTQLLPLPLALYGTNSYFIQEMNKIFICGGADAVANQTNCYMYDPLTNMYEAKAPLPMGRSLGKLVRVKDSLFLIGSVGTSFTAPDGLILKYNINGNQWSIRDTTPLPKLHLSAVSVYNDSIIYIIGGSAGGFSAPANLIRMFNPEMDTLINLTGTFPINIMDSHAEFDRDSSGVIIVMGGVSTTFLNSTFKGNLSADGRSIEWLELGTTPYGIGVYRVAGGRWNDLMLFGPTVRNFTNYPNTYAFDFKGNDTAKWIKFLPVNPDSASNFGTLAVDQSTDSIRFYHFGGLKYPTVLNYAYKFTAPVPIIIGLKPVSDVVPSGFKLEQNYPNPFNPKTNIRFNIPAEARSDLVLLRIYNSLGQLVESIVNENLRSGEYEVSFDASKYSSGLYFYTLTSGNFRQTKKMILIK